MRDQVIELQVPRGHDHAHSADADDPLDAVSSGERVAR